MKIFTIFKCLIRFLNHLFTILKFFVDVLSVMWRNFPLTEVIMPSNKKPPWGPGPPASQAPPSSAEGGKSSRRQPCCCAIDMVICFYTVACCLLPALRVIWVGGYGCFFEQPACRDLVYIIESQGDIMNDQMQAKRWSNVVSATLTLAA